MVPDSSNHIYRSLVLGEQVPALKCLGLKIFLGRLQQLVRADKSPENIERQIEALHTFFCHNESLARKDIEVIFKVGAND